MSFPSISVIVTTYNWPEALHRVLIGLCDQKYKNLEVIVADDGSGSKTSEMIWSLKEKCDFALSHCWQPDDGFRAAMIRNRAAAMAKNDYLIFIDGDCIPSRQFIFKHAKLAEKKWFVAGSRVLLNQDLTTQILNKSLSIENWSLPKWCGAYFSRQCNRMLPHLSLPLGPFRKMRPRKWQGAKTCNLGVYKEDFMSVNGLDESFTGWGFEDSDLVVRLQKKGIFHKSGKLGISVLHLWHPIENRNNLKENKERFYQTINSPHIKARSGVDQYSELK